MEKRNQKPRKTTPPITSTLDFAESNKRRIVRISLDPTGKLLAAADTLGRVLLFDMRYISTVLRIWKGVREARFAWSMDVTPSSGTCADGDESEGYLNSSRKSFQLSLAIYAPQLGLLSLYQMRHGPCLRSIPVGPQCQIFTIQQVSPSGEILHKCALIRTFTESPMLQLSIVSPFDHADDDLDLNELQAQAEAMRNSRDEGDAATVGNKRSDNGDAGGVKLADMLISNFAMLSLFPPKRLSSSSVTRCDADPSTQEGKADVREQTLRFVLKLEKLLKGALSLLDPKDTFSELHDGNANSKTESAVQSMANIEHRIWVLLSSSAAQSLFLSSLSSDDYDGEGVALLLHCITLIERVEVKMYIQQAHMEGSRCPVCETRTGSSHSHNGNSKASGMLFFTLQFHRNLCRLIEDIGTAASTHSSAKIPSDSIPAILVHYAQNRLKLIKAYILLMDINMHLSLSQMTVQAAQCAPMSSDKSTKLDMQGQSESDLNYSLRDEAKSWSARFLRPHYKSTTNKTAGPLSSTSNPRGGNTRDSSDNSDVKAGNLIGIL